MRSDYLGAVLVSVLAACRAQTVDLGAGNGQPSGPGGSTEDAGTLSPPTHCGGGSCVVVANAYTHQLAADATTLYWTQASGGTSGVGTGAIMSLPLAGGSPRTLASGLQSPSAIAVDGTSVYWTLYAPGSTAGSSILKMPLGGGTPSTLLAGRDNPPMGITVGGSDLYWFEDAIFGMPVGGGAIVTVAADENQHGAIAVDSTRVYWTDTALGTIEAAPLAGGSPVTLADAQDRPTPIAVDANNVYWANATTIARAPLAGGTPTTLASGQDNPVDLAVDDTNVYWVCSQGGSVVRVPIAGGAAVTLANYLTAAGGLVVDATSVYFGADKLIVKRTPK